MQKSVKNDLAPLQKPYFIKSVNKKGLRVTGVCDRKGLVDTFLRHLSLGTPCRSRHYLLLQMDEEKL